MANQIQLRRGTSAEWAASTRILAQGEVGIDLTLGEMRLGDGVTAWAGLTSIGAVDPADVDAAVAAYLLANPPAAAPVDSVNGQTGAVVLDASDVGADPAGTAAGLVDALDIPAPPDLSGYVPTSRTVNGQALTGDITLDAADVGALPDTYAPDLSGYTPTSGLADVATSGSYADLSDKPTIPDSADDIDAAPASGQATVNALTAAASVTVPATHSMHTLTMTTDTTLVFSNPTAGHAFTLKLSGAFTPTFPASVTWAGGTAPTYASGKVYVFATFDAGTSWIGSAL